MKKKRRGTKQQLACFVDRDLATAAPCGELFDEGAEISGFRPTLSDISLRLHSFMNLVLETTILAPGRPGALSHSTLYIEGALPGE